MPMRRPGNQTEGAGRGHDHDMCPRCCANVSGRTNAKGHRGYREPPRAYMLKPWEREAVKKPEQRNDASGAAVPLTGNLMQDHPNIWAMLTDDKWDDGSKRQRATILIVCDGPVLKLWLGDKACNRSAWVSGESLENAFAALEDQLASSSLPWRPMENKQQNRGRRG